MPTEDVAYQQRLKIRRSTLGFGVIQVVLGLALTGLSFTAFVLSESEKIRNACPYWAGFTVFCSGGVGVVAWRYTTVLSMGLFTFFSAVCVVLHMIGTILTGEIGGLLKSIIMCQDSVTQSCFCCDSIMTCKQKVPTFEFQGVDDCAIITGLMKELMYGLCVLNIFGSLVCFIATILGCTSVARQAGRDQPLFRRRLSTRSDSHEQSQYSWLHYPADANILPPYAPPIYRSVDNVQDCGATSYIVPPPVFDPTDLPPPYSSRNASLSSSGLSLDVQNAIPPGGRPRDSDDSAGGSTAIVLLEGGTLVRHHFEQRVYSENRPRPGHHSQVTNVVLTRSGILERCGMEPRTDHLIQSINSSHGSLASEKAQECRESSESISDKDKNYKSRGLSTVEHSRELIMFEDNHNKRNSKKEDKRNAKSTHRKSCKLTEDEFSSTSDSGIGDELPILNTSLEGNDDCDGDIDSYEKESMGVGEDIGLDSDVDRKQQDCDLNHLTFSTRDAISLDGQEVDDIRCISTDTLVNIMESEHEEFSEACHSYTSGLDLMGNIIEELPISLIDSQQRQAPKNEIICMSKVEDVIGIEEDSVDGYVTKENEISTLESGMVQFGENTIHERHVTEEVIRLMDDFETNSMAKGACSVETSSLELKHLRNVKQSEHASDLPVDKVCSRKREHSVPPCTSSFAVEEIIHPPYEASARLGREYIDRTRSDTCIAVLSKSARESRTGSDPGVSSVGRFAFPGHNFTFQLVPPNVELPLEIQEENMCGATKPQENKRSKRQSVKEVLGSKRRAFVNKDELMRQKAKCQHRASRKDETEKLRERHQKTQKTRLRVEATRSHLQSYKAKSSAQRRRDGWLRDSAVWPSLWKGKTPQRHATLNEPSGENSACECGTCTGKETIV